MNFESLFDVSGEIVLISGAAGQLGVEYANAFVQRGARVVGLDLFPSKRSEALQVQHPERYMFCMCDVTNKATLEQALNNIVNKFGTPTVLINNAAIDSPPSAPPEENGPFEDYPESSWDKAASKPMMMR